MTSTSLDTIPFDSTGDEATHLSADIEDIKANNAQTADDHSFVDKKATATSVETPNESFTESLEKARTHDNEDHLSPISNKIFSQCDMCDNYEAQLTQHQHKERELRDELAAAKHLNQRYVKELNNERASRVDYESIIEQKIKDKSDEVQSILTNIKAELWQKFGAAEPALSVAYIENQLSSLRETKEALNNNNAQWKEKLQSLLNSQVSSHEKLLAEEIALPNTIDELQSLALQLQEQLINQVGSREYAQKEADVLTFALQEAHDRIEELQDEIRSLQEIPPTASTPSSSVLSIGTLDSPESKDGLTHSRTLTKTIDRLQAKIEQQNAEMIRMQEKMKQAEHKCEKLRSELDTSVSVQRDFVKLSQELQMQLEQIRQNETDVRWQFPEDATECSHCRSVFTTLSNSIKLNCRHCGKIHCDKCLSMTVPAGPQRRAARVCQLCHTLLNKQERPFFSRKSVEVEK